MVPTLGRIVHYVLAEHDIKRIASLPGQNNPVAVGDIVPAIIVKMWGSTAESAFNARAFLDGNGAPLWLTSTSMGNGEPGKCVWPPRA